MRVRVGKKWESKVVGIVKSRNLKLGIIGS